VPPNEVTEISYRISEIIKYIGETLYSIILPKWFPIPGRREFLANLNETRETVNRIIAKCRQNKELSAGLIQMLIDSVDEDSHEQMTEKQLFDEVMTIFIAGYETTATVLTWLGVIIQRHPEILEKLRAEVDQVLGQRMPTFEDVSHLTYTRKVFMETLRMYTPGAFLPRALDQDDKLGNYDIPADSMIIIFYHGLHHNPQVWEKPEVFDPERFTTEQIAARHPFAYIPFSAGPRKCVGDEFAMLEGPLSIAMILQKYNLNILPDQNFSAKMGATMRPGNGVKATLSLRNLG
jgi:cytochrome P450